MQEGAMLHLANLHETHLPLQELVDQLAQELRCRVFINAHAGFHQSRGFDVHWDGHDVFVLQISGRKRWRIFGVTEQYPLPVSPEEKKGAPSDPIWEGVLNTGDAIYMPRGFWHSAAALEDNTLHLTVGIVNQMGRDFLNWLIRRLEAQALVRQDIPILAPEGIQKEWLQGLRQLLCKEVSTQNLMEFFEIFDRNFEVTERVVLPS
jgi:ribosomal protein L16 Arg81 hydroxylase